MQTIILTGAAFTVLFALLRGVYRTVKRVESTYELVNHELRPNSGGSLWDKIHRIDARVEVLESVDRRHKDRRTEESEGVE